MKINLLIIFLFTSPLLQAQIKKGGLFLGGDMQISGSTYGGETPNEYTNQYNHFNFSPVMGVVIKDNVIVGGRLFASFSHEKQQPSMYNNKSNRLGAGIWMRRYMPLGRSFYFFGDAGLNGLSIYGKQTQAQQPDYYKEKGFGINAAFYPGLAYQVRRNLFMEASLNNLISIGYERKNIEQGNQAGSIKERVNNSYKLSTSVGNGVPLQLGIRWIIAKK